MEKYYATPSDDYHYAKIFKPTGEYVGECLVKDADRFLRILNQENARKTHDLKYWRAKVNAKLNEKVFVAQDERNICIQLNDDYESNTFPIHTVIIETLNDLFGQHGMLNVVNMSLGDDFRPSVWLTYYNVVEGDE
ncbi:MAG: hypothetical protein IKR04_02235 [Clostridia bacterium]|nr:hypothetical protein [Clostridia bacterium]